MHEYIIRSKLNQYQVYGLHKEIMKHFSAGGHLLNENRPIWRSHECEGGCIILCRSPVKPLTPTKTSEAHFECQVGDTVQFTTRLCTTQKIRDSQGRTITEKFVPASEMASWLKGVVAEKGMELANCAVLSNQKVRVKEKHFSFPGADVVFNAKVLDADLVTLAYNKGIGSKRAFGYGLLVEG